MKIQVFLMVFSLAVTLGCFREQTGEVGARLALDKAAETMGGWKALRGVRGQRIVSEGSAWDPLQAMKPGDTRQVNSHSASLTATFERKAMRLEFHAQLMYPYEGSQQQFTEVIDGDIGMLEQSHIKTDVEQSRLHSSRYATRLRDLNRMPVRVLITASLAHGLNRLPDRAEGATSFQVVQYQDVGQKAELEIDSSTHLPASIAYLEDNPNLGDTWNKWVWSDWRDVDGVRLPFGQEQQLNGLMIGKETIQQIQNNPPIAADAFLIPEKVRQVPEVGERIVSQWVLRRVAMWVSYLELGRPQKATLEPLAPGVWLATGSGDQTLVIEMKDYLMIVEAPYYEERSLAVIQAIKDKFPAKPIQYAVVTHYHDDHSGGIRAYAAEGATVVAHSSIIPFLESVLKRPKTVRPDSLARLEAKLGKQPPIALEGVETMKEYSDGTRTVRLYHLTPNPHDEGMLLTYLPKERITFTADMVSPTALTPPVVIEPRGLAYYEFVKQQGLKVDRIARVHGPPIPFRQFAALVEKSP